MIKAALSELLPDTLFYRLEALAMRRQEPELRHLATFVPAGRAALDVGAWWGPWTYWLSRRGRTVTAVEPQRRLADFLARVTGPTVDVRCVALSDVEGSADLIVPDHRRGQDALAHLQRSSAGSDSGERESVAVKRLDDFELRNLGFIKIDVEGHEQEVIAGAADTIRRERPTLFVEIEQRHLGDRAMATVFESICRHGYDGLFLRKGVWHRLEAFDIERDQLDVLPDLTSADYINNFLFVPEESDLRPESSASTKG